MVSLGKGAGWQDMIRIVIAVVAICAIGGFVYWQGGKSARLQTQTDFNQTSERMRDATSNDRSPDAINDRLRELTK